MWILQGFSPIPPFPPLLHPCSLSRTQKKNRYLKKKKNAHVEKHQTRKVSPASEETISISGFLGVFVFADEKFRPLNLRKEEKLEFFFFSSVLFAFSFRHHGGFDKH